MRDFTSVYEHVKSGIEGRIAMNAPCANILQFVCHVGSGDHLEIGALWGGTAILAGLSRTCTVYCIDPMAEDDPNGYRSTPEGFETNIAAFGVDAVLIQKKSNPWPKELEGMEFGTALIDGDHGWRTVLWDWEHVSKVTRQYVIFHDLQMEGPRLGFETAAQDKNWRPLINLAEMDVNIGVLERVK